MRRHLLVTNDFPPKVGGIQSYLWELWSRLDPERFVVLTARSHEDADTFDAEQLSNGIRIIRVSGKYLFFPTPAAARTIRGVAADVEADFVILDPALPLGLLGPHLGLPFGVILHGAEVTIPGRIPVSRQAMARVLCASSFIISAGAYPAAEGARAAGGHLPPVIEVPPGVDCRRYVPIAEERRAEVRESLGLPTAGPLVVSVSRLVPRKGMDVLIEAAVRLHPSFPDLTVAIAGTGREQARLEAQVRSTGAPVRLLGRITDEEKISLLGAADVFTMACRNRWIGLEQEGFGIVFVEAAACGVSQVAGDSGGAAEAVEDGVTGFVVERPEDPGEVAGALRRLLVDPALRRRMGAAARERAVGSFDYALLAPRLERAIAELPEERDGSLTPRVPSGGTTQQVPIHNRADKGG